MLRLVVLRLLSCLCLVLSCLALASVLVLSYLLRVVFLLRCAACLSSWADLSTHFCSFGVVLGVDVGHFGSSWGALGTVLGGLLGVLGGLERPGKRLMDPSQQSGKSRAAEDQFSDRLGGPRGRQDGPKTAP